MGNDNYIGMKLDGRYELTELIGTGGMAEIYKADDIAEGKTVAVKILKNEFAGSEEFLRRFRNESKAIALLSHPNIVKIFDVGFTDRVQFIVMEYIDGITLIDYIEKQGVLKWRDALGFTGQVLKALQHAHDRGIVHRDVKSQNVMLLRDGTIKVMDFGIARFNREIDKNMSEKAIGSVHYISPEQARGDITDEKSDLYSVGVMLYEMLTGVKPFDGDDVLSIALMHTNRAPKRPSEINSAIPKGLEEITLRAMQKSPAKRYQTAGEMLGDLKEFEKNPSVVFEYKYAAPDGGDKYLNKAGNPVANAAAAAVMPPKPSNSADVYDDDDDYDEDEKIERRSPLLPILFAVASAFVILTAVLITLIVQNGIAGDDSGGGNFFGGRNRKMPDLRGMEYAAAAQEFKWLRMEARQVYSADFPRNVIIDQDVPADRMIKPTQTVVVVQVSKGKEVIYMPSFGTVLGQDVLDELNGLGLFASPVQVYDNTIAEGFFIKTDYNPGDELSKGDSVRVFISKGREEDMWRTKVPNMLGLNENAAKQKAIESRITIQVITEESSAEDKGLVIKQSIDPDEEVENQSVVEITIGLGPTESTTGEAVREFPIGIEIPEGATGEFTFRHFIDSVLQENLTKRIDLATLREYIWPVTGSETSAPREYMLKIKNEATGREAVFAIYKIDFSTNPPTGELIGELNTNILNEISAPEPPAE